MSADSAEAPVEDSLAAAFARALGHGKASEGLTATEAAFLRQMREDYVADELPGLTEADLAANLAELWRFAARRENSDPAMRILPALGEAAGDVARLDIVQDDTLFLVDSVMAQIAEADLVVRAMFHGVVEVGRDAAGRRREGPAPKRESMIQVMLEAPDEARARALLAELETTLADVRAATSDYAAMLALMDRAIGEVEKAPVTDPKASEEYVAFLRWVKDNHFVFLGARCYDYPRKPGGGYAAEEPLYQPEDGLGVLRDPEQRVLRRRSEPAILDARLQRHLMEDPPLTVAKADLRSRVHRGAAMDYIGVRRFGEDGKPAGEIRFVGLFTSEAYDSPVVDTPLLRRKAAFVLDRAAKTQGGHSDRRLRNILASYPRDELFQTAEADLLRIALGVVHLQDRPRVGLFSRRDPFDRFVSVLLYVPAQSYEAGLVERAGAILSEAFDGQVASASPSFTAGPLARIHYIVAVRPGDHPDPSPQDLEARIAEIARTWPSQLDAALRADPSTREHAGDLFARYAAAFPLAYRDRFDAEEALADIAVLEAMGPDETVRLRAYRRPNDTANRFRFKLYHPGQAAPLAAVLPILEPMGLRALEEDGFAVERTAQDGATTTVWLHEFVVEDERTARSDLAAAKDKFEEAFIAVWTGQTESDGFNRLVLEPGMSWREATLIRSLARYRQQTGLDPSQGVQEAALRDNPAIAALLLDLFKVKFDPASGQDGEARLKAAKARHDAIVEALQAVESLDADRVLRRLAALLCTMVRTNYFQPASDGTPKPYISFKIASRELADLPAPKPFREIFVWAPHVEGVHLRFGPIARGGLRWSDRREDFRTEVLGLAKAQQVKNAVIVPVGAKGGFFPKTLPRNGAPDAIQAEAIRAYKTFLRGLLDLTDNLSPKGQVVPPPDVVVLDEDDPYLVVAADKGTASFSDIANGIAVDYGFWLGDAFASGGSAGYDHKAMGITARGAWEAVKRHFRERGKDIQAEPFTVIGVGDMSGDVFGNGMLMSRQTRLVAAFDHRHVFLDPEPDPEASFKERQRLFDLPRSSWADYDKALISKGGGVFARTLKSVPISAEVRDLLDISDASLTPAELIHSILKAPAELLYLGGIGAYVKSPRESHADVGDKANDAIRVDADELRVKVVGEGANLGVTQAGRIAYAQAGGRIDTDAIDNSAGVDTSDHEVNIKIVTAMAERTGDLTRKRRNKLLQSMTDDIAAHVLRHNYDQTLALSLLQRDAAGEIGQQARYIADLEARGRLDRKVEGLPSPAEFAERTQAGEGLTRPELAVLLAYGKLDLDTSILDSPAPDDPALLGDLDAYFPKPLRKFGDQIERHRLRREIISTALTNRIVDVCGPTFAPRIRAAAACETADVVAGYEAARASLGIDLIWARVAELDGQAPAQVQLDMFAELAAVLRATTYWLTRRAAHTGAGPVLGRAIKRSGGRGKSPIRELTEAYQPAFKALISLGPDILSQAQREAVGDQAKTYEAAGAPLALAAQVAALRPMIAAADIGDLASVAKRPIADAARIYHAVGSAFGFDRARIAATGLKSADEFERLALRRLVEDTFQEQVALTRAVAKDARSIRSPQDADALIAAWSDQHPAETAAVRSAIDAVAADGEAWSFAKLTIVNAALRALSLH